MICDPMLLLRDALSQHPDVQDAETAAYGNVDHVSVLMRDGSTLRFTLLADPHGERLADSLPGTPYVVPRIERSVDVALVPRALREMSRFRSRACGPEHIARRP